MGIPSYFSYIIKNHAKIVRRLQETGHVHHLFMDCNSIIYDLFHALESKEVVDENQLIQQIVDKIQQYVKYIRPSKTLYVAFDGVAPLAKMDQQRTRRHKTMWMEPNKTGWSTCNITPGTPFMQALSVKVHAVFDHQFAQAHGIDQVVVSAASECGEGEHKLFQHIRKNRWVLGDGPFCRNIQGKDTAAVYGLDSDLIMLSLFHCDRFDKIFVFRETPEFVKSQIPCTPDDPCHFLDIGHLCSAILREMKKTQTKYIYDYVFMCFFLGNDFLPHFPSLNLRTHGLQVLLHTYRKVFPSSQPYSLIDNDKTIQWTQVQRFIKELAKREHELWLQEYDTRCKWANRQWSTATPQDCDYVLQNVPVIYRAEELYIAPDQSGWQHRYYKSLLHNTPPETVCRNYLEGLAWVFQYYTQDCQNWRWKYQYHYPPLLQDLVKTAARIPSTVVYESQPPFSPAAQLAYVTPMELHKQLVDATVVERLDDALFRRPSIPYRWAFCRYFWESHVLLADISPQVMESWM
jgi:5'-3' exonuclease